MIAIGSHCATDAITPARREREPEVIPRIVRQISIMVGGYGNALSWAGHHEPIGDFVAALLGVG
jgi:multisubunit Na+/H+ antiporter MnhB subunit